MLDNLLKEKGYTKYRLSKESGVSTVRRKIEFNKRF